MESPGTKGYTPDEVRALFSAARVVNVETVVTAYDMRVGRRRFCRRGRGAAFPLVLAGFTLRRGRSDCCREANEMLL